MDTTSQPDQLILFGPRRGVSDAEPWVSVDTVLAWLLAAFDTTSIPHIIVVAENDADRPKVTQAGTDIHTVVHDRSVIGPVQSLAHLPNEPRAGIWLATCDAAFRPHAVTALRQATASVAVAVDTSPRQGGKDVHHDTFDLHLSDVHTISGPIAPATARFTGLLRFSSAAMTQALALLASNAVPAHASVLDLLHYLYVTGIPIQPVDVRGHWTALDAPTALARFALGTKAQSLARLRTLPSGGIVDDLVFFTLHEWMSDQASILNRILTTLSGPLIIRSSAQTEGAWLDTAAGRFLTIGNVVPSHADIILAVDAVFTSYGPALDNDEVLVQQMHTEVLASGVASTRTHARLSPYYVFNFVDSASPTNAVTSGQPGRTVYLHRTAPCEFLPQELTSVLFTVQSIERLLAHDALDLEFVITPDRLVHILQVRHIPVPLDLASVDDSLIAAAIEDCRPFLAEPATPPPHLLGPSTRYSVMCDWNPAEIIGTTPRRLAFSLYRRIITDHVWAQQRAQYGYRDVRPSPLLVDILGHPYVDVRASFNSFIPASLPTTLSTRLVEAALDLLDRFPTRHDKVEFEVLFTCLTPDFHLSAAERLEPYGFQPAEIALLHSSLRELTEHAIDRIHVHAAELRTVDAAITNITSLPLVPLDRAHYLLDVATRSGTLLFAHLARTAFIATAILRSLVRVGALTVMEHDEFLRSVRTVQSRMREDGARVGRGHLRWDDFVAAYGHLRPGTYDIASLCYRAAPEEYLRPVTATAHNNPAPEAGADPWSGGTRRRVAQALQDVGLQSDVSRFQSFARTAIIGREDAKFSFTKAVSEALEAVAVFGSSRGFSRDDLAHLDIDDLLSCRDPILDRQGYLARRVVEGRLAWTVAQAICLPAQLITDRDLYCFEQQLADPTFVTQLAVEGTPVRPDPATDATTQIVLLVSADPGYEWLLARPLGGLVTMYGGPNSHMAVRAAELGLPAAIGVGETLYASLLLARRIRLDCGARVILAIE